MRIFVLTSRYTANRDIVAEDFGRQVRLFAPFVERGHHVDLVCADYRQLERGRRSLRGMNVHLLPFSAARAPAFIANAAALLHRGRYDALVASSDPLWGVLGYPLARTAKTRFIYDIQDNYDIYRTSRLPLVRQLERVATRHADLVVAASSILADRARARRPGPVVSIPNGVDLGLFRPHDKVEARVRLGISTSARVLGYVGTLQSAQGVDRLVSMLAALRRDAPEVVLLLAGRMPEGERIDIARDGIRYLGSVAQADVPFVIAASDVMVMPYPRNEFTEVMESPYKLMEYYACDRPVVLTDVGTMARYSPDRALVADPGSNADIVEKIRYALTIARWESRSVAIPFGWSALSERLEAAMVAAA